MRIPHLLLALLAFPLALSAQSALSARPALPVDGNTLAAANPEVRRAQPVARSTAAAPSSAASGGSTSGVAFRNGDTFELRMTGMPAEDALPYATAFTISGDGMVNIPLGGQVRAAGLTQSQLEKAIERRLIEEKIFTSPTAIISIPNQARYVTVGGNVRSPNRQVWASDLTLLVAVEAAGGPSDFAGDKIDLIRKGAKTQFSLKLLKRDPANDPPLQPGDRLDLR